MKPATAIHVTTVAGSASKLPAMLHRFLTDHRSELIARCRAKVALRALPGPLAIELDHGITVFLDQLIKTLQVEEGVEPLRSREVSGPSGGGQPVLSEMGKSAAAHGRELLENGFTVEELVHDYGDLCQSITGLALEQDSPFTMEEFRTLNRCLDNAIANAITEYTYQRDFVVADRQAIAFKEHLGYFAHELRNHLSTATLALMVMKTGNVGVNSATGAVLDRSLVNLRNLIDRSLSEVRMNAGVDVRQKVFSLASFIGELKSAADLEASVKGCTLRVAEVDPELAVDADRDLLFSAVGNLLQNAFKYTRPGTEVRLQAYAAADRILVEVKDECGGLPGGDVEALFMPFVQADEDRSGLGLGLAIARRSVEANGGHLRARDLPGRGCVFTIDLPRLSMP
ncbi:HAMP domain-containing sensor histidine kinase [Luteimonas sp. 8-5]|uniref:sensor histidine kinase n=1 Tax=Luteimonas sp. 8-5 TaxID=3039387 RepID=UPI002436DE56|nr:HAMP domain-containing sensor histidine kinase [Luteimonas sp. 8-5]MDG6348101.1 HAMP domain-containing sensor histidine kinase [Luteimonas sp. 8-5]